MKIIVTGSLGNISQPLTKELVQQGHAVVVISSKPEKQKDIEALGATAAIGTLEDADFLSATFTGANAVYCMIPPDLSEPNQVAYYRRIAGNYIKAIQQSGVKRVIHLSSYGAHLDKGTGLILGAHHVEVMLNELPGIAVTHMRPAYFYYNLFSFIEMIKHTGVITANYGGEDRIVLVSPIDIAAAIAGEIVTPAAPGSNVHYVASDERTASEIAGVLGAVIGKPDLKWTVITNEQMQSSMEAHGVPASLVTSFVEMFASIHSGALTADYYLDKPAMGKVKLEDFAKEFAAAFKK